MNREVALKVLPAEYAQDSDHLRRFEQEAMARSSLNHMNNLTFYDSGTHEGNPFIVMELLDSIEGTNYAPSKDIQRYFVPVVTEKGPWSPINVVLNWTADLKK